MPVVRLKTLAAACLSLWAVSCCFSEERCYGEEWSRFRGPNGAGLAAEASPPTRWSIEGKENIAWTADLPGKGLSSPIVVDDKVVVTSASGYRHDRLHVICFSAESGEKLWERQLWATGRTMTFPTISPAAPTPVAADGRIFAIFSTNDIVCLDLAGNVQWVRGLMLNYRNASNSLGLASSPIVVDETLVVKLETDSESLAVGLDVLNGGLRWKLDRPKVASWTSPLAVPAGAGKQAVVLQSAKGATGHDARTGKELWRFDQPCGQIPSCVAAGDVIYMPSQGLSAIRVGESATAEVLWKNNRLGPSTPTPLVVGDRLYVISGSVLSAADAASGEQLWQLRLKGSFSSSPVAAGKLIYVVNDEGLAQVIEPGQGKERGKIVGEGDFHEPILCTPAIAGDALYIRSDAHLWKVSAR